MRLIFSDEFGAQLLAVELPDPDVIAEISKNDFRSGAVFFGSGNTADEKSWKVSSEQLLSAGTKLAGLLQELDTPRVQEITVELDNGTKRGPARSMTGFSLNGVPAGVGKTISGGFRVLLCHRENDFEERDLTGVTEFRLDQGIVIVKYTTAQTAFAGLVGRISTILQELDANFVWLHIEY